MIFRVGIILILVATTTLALPVDEAAQQEDPVLAVFRDADVTNHVQTDIAAAEEDRYLTEYRCELNVNFQGHCVATTNCPAKGLSLQACKTLCDNTSGCKVIVHNKYNGGSCYLKREKGNTVPDAPQHETRGCVKPQNIPSRTPITPYTPTAGWTYVLEAARAKNWPACAYRFASYPGSCNSVDLWKSAGGNQHWMLESAGQPSTFYLKASCGSYLGYQRSCSSNVMTMTRTKSAFKFIRVGTNHFTYYLLAAGRSHCPLRYASFPGSCTTGGADKIDLWLAAGTNQRFRIHPVSSMSPHTHTVNADAPCADPYAFSTVNEGRTVYKMQCTGGALTLSSSSTIGPSSVFRREGTCLSGSVPAWISGHRWAPENTVDATGKFNLVFFSSIPAGRPNGVHRIGWAASAKGASKGAYSKYSQHSLHLSNAPGGEIDPTVFHDSDGKMYLSWKSDDNACPGPCQATTRLWLQEIAIRGTSVSMLGPKRVIMDSSGLWWVTSFINGGALAEGPELIKHAGMYYLFFAAGRYCQDSYSEGVARSTSIWGPYEKMPVPLLSTGLVGRARGQHGMEKLIGPGHASFVQDATTGSWFAVWHASIGQNCNRFPFISRMVFGKDGWPRIEL